nr:MAG: hypothetical protein DiTV3a_F17ORF2 [Diabrotica toursvirus 3a]
MKILEIIASSLNEFIFDFTEKIGNEFNIPQDDLLQVWCDQQEITLVSFEKYKSKKKTVVVIPENVDEQEEISTTTIDELEEPIGCCYVFTRGSKKGTVCGNTLKSGNYCTKHRGKPVA